MEYSIGNNIISIEIEEEDSCTDSKNNDLKVKVQEEKICGRKRKNKEEDIEKKIDNTKKRGSKRQSKMVEKNGRESVESKNHYETEERSSETILGFSKSKRQKLK